MTDQTNLLGKRIRALRLKKGVSIDELSRETGVSFGAIIALEHGKTKNPSMRTVYSIAAYFGMTVEQLLLGKETHVQF